MSTRDILLWLVVAPIAWLVLRVFGSLIVDAIKSAAPDAARGELTLASPRMRAIENDAWVEAL